ncbi:hypothetical protein ACN47E_006177 [Coniothyrium glycines]
MPHPHHTSSSSNPWLDANTDFPPSPPPPAYDHATKVSTPQHVLALLQKPFQGWLKDLLRARDINDD